MLTNLSRLSREFDLLEGEVAITLLDPTVSLERRVEIEQRLSAIRARMPTVPTVPAPPMADEVDNQESPPSR